MKRLNDHNDCSSRPMKYRNISADVIISPPEATIADVANEVRRWFDNDIQNEGDLELSFTDEDLRGFLALNIGDYRQYKFLFHPVSQQLGEKLHDHLRSFCSSSKSAFNLHYVNPELIVTRQFLNHIEYCLKLYQDDKNIYAPYFVFCQSSG